MRENAMSSNNSNLRVVEKKVLGAMLILADDNMNLETTFQRISEAMGYRSTGGAITFAIQALEMKNYIAVVGKGKYRILL